MDESRSDVGPLTRPDVLAPIVDEAINGPYEFLEVVIETTGQVNSNEGTLPLMERILSLILLSLHQPMLRAPLHTTLSPSMTLKL